MSYFPISKLLVVGSLRTALALSNAFRDWRSLFSRRYMPWASTKQAYFVGALHCTKSFNSSWRNLDLLNFELILAEQWHIPCRCTPTGGVEAACSLHVNLGNSGNFSACPGIVQFLCITQTFLELLV